MALQSDPGSTNSATARTHVSQLESTPFLTEPILPGQNHTSSYPVLTLPDDIVSEIFHHFLPVYPLRPPPYGTDCPTNLTSICRLWRDIALLTPSLWRAIQIEIYVDNSTATIVKRRLLAYILHLFETWMARPKGCLLSIHFDYYDYGLEDSKDPSDCITLLFLTAPVGSTYPSSCRSKCLICLMGPYLRFAICAPGRS